MTDSDLQTVRDWCRANGVTIEHDCNSRFSYKWYTKYLPSWLMEDEFGYAGKTERECYERIWRALKPIIQSVRNLDAVPVEGPFKVHDYWRNSGKFYVSASGHSTHVASLSEQSARIIAGILNRESRGE